MAHEQLIQRIFDEIINAGNVDAADELMTDDFVDHGPMGDQSREEFKDLVRMWRAAVPDVHCEIVGGVIVDGDNAAWLIRTTGTHTGEMMGIPASGKSVDLLSPNIGLIRDGRAAEHWADQSMFQFLSQIGAIPAPGAAA